MKNNKKIAVVGAGAAGFMAAITAKEFNINNDVTILEKTNKVLSKVKISGGGRCNVTNATFSVSQLIKKYPRGGNKLKKSFNLFNTNHTIEWFKNRGVELKTEKDKRMFPKSNDSQTIVETLISTAKNLNIHISLKNKVNAIKVFKKKIILNVNNKNVFFDKVIIASGGSSKMSALNWISELDYKIVPPVPSLFTFNMPDSNITKLMGLSVKNVFASIKGSSLRQSGPLLITHWGMSGPAILKLSAWGAKYLEKLNYDFIVQVNWLAINESELRIKFLEIILSRKSVYSYNPFNIPKRLWVYILNKLEIRDNQIWGELSKKNINRIINTLTNDEFFVKGKTTFKEEFVTCGGVDLSEINMQSMQSKRHKNIFFAGEILNIDGVTGGFNFQAAWTTGFLAGKNITL